VSASGVAIPGTREIDRRRWRSAAPIVAILASFAVGAAASTAVSAALQDVPVEPMSRPAAVAEPRARIHAPRQETIVAGIAEAELAGCSVVLKMGGALLEDAFEFRRATRVLAHQLMALQNLDRVTSRVTRVDDRVAGVVYGERCP
jgi:hypothetical protein